MADLASSMVTVRRASEPDLPALMSLFEEFVRGHKAERHGRPIEVYRQEYFGPAASTRIFLAELRGQSVGMGLWRKVFDFFWGWYGGEIEGLYVRPSVRGLGVAPAILAAMCADMRGQGARFAHSTYDDHLAAFYERVAVGSAQRSCFVSAKAFQVLADLAGAPPRVIARSLPARELNFVPEDS